MSRLPEAQETVRPAGTGTDAADAGLSHLPVYLAVAYALLVIYASLHPFSGWRDSGVDPWTFLSAAWPRYWTVFDITSNVLAYFPLGFVWVPALQGRCGRLLAFFATLLLAVLLSLVLEAVQNYLPSRVASNIDLMTNGGGALLGALAGRRWGRLLLDGGRMHALSQRYTGGGAVAQVGVLLMGLWLLSQLNPETLLFGNGDIRVWLADLGLLDPQDYVAEDFPWLEAAVTASNALALGLVCRCLLRRRSREWGMGLIVTALGIRTLSLTLLTGNAGLAWATDGALLGLGLGVALWLPLSLLPRGLCRVLAALALLAATTLVNVMPQNPYLGAILQLWQQGHFLNFNGLTRLASILWPFLVLPWLILWRPPFGMREGEREVS